MPTLQAVRSMLLAVRTRETEIAPPPSEKNKNTQIAPLREREKHAMQRSNVR